MFKRIPSFLCLFAGLLLSACADMPAQGPGSGPEQGSGTGGGALEPGSGNPGGGRRIEALANAGGQEVINIDLVFIYDDSLSEHLPARTGSWFAAREQLLANAGGLLERVSLELPASFASGPLRLPERADGAQRVLLYADHAQTPEAVDLTARRRIALRLYAGGLDVADL